MQPAPYIGVTGFMTPQEVRAALRRFTAFVPRKLMVGVLASSKTLRGQPNKWPGRYPVMERMKEIFQSHDLAVNLIHYNTDDPATLAEQLIELIGYAGPHLHGFQLNVAWPPPNEITKFHEATDSKYRIVLQIDGRAMAEVDDNPVRLAYRVSQWYYGGSFHDILIDSSGGKGQPFDLAKARDILGEFKFQELLHLWNLGIAGGLGPSTVKRLAPLLEEHPNLNWDAEGQLRDPDSDDLDMLQVANYLDDSLEMVLRLRR